MFIAVVKGNVVSTQKDKLLPKPQFEPPREDRRPREIGPTSPVTLRTPPGRDCSWRRVLAEGRNGEVAKRGVNVMREEGCAAGAEGV